MQRRPPSAAGPFEGELSADELEDRARKLGTSERALRQQSRILRSALSCVGEGIVVADRSGSLVLFNPAAERMLAIAPGEQGTCAWSARSEFFLPDRRTPHPPDGLPLARAVRGEPTDDVEIYVRQPGRPQGIFVSCSGRTLRDGRGAVAGGVVSFRDITKRHEIEEAKDEFIATVSHELRTPITSILGALCLASGGALGAVPARVQGVLDLAHRNAQRLSRLVNDVLDVSVIEAGKTVLRRSVQPVAPLVDAAVANARAPSARLGVKVERVGAAPGALVDVDPDLFEQILAHLLSNAAKFSPRGEAVQVELSRQGNRIRVTVSDRGPGIPDSFRARIFQRFSQADGSDSRPTGGAGLGLSIAKALSELLGGTLGYDSTPGAGSRFHFELPEAICPAEGTPGTSQNDDRR